MLLSERIGRNKRLRMLLVVLFIIAGAFGAYAISVMGNADEGDIHTVTFTDYQGVFAEVPVVEGSSVSDPGPAPAPDGKVFAGWEGGIPAAVYGNMTIAAVYVDAPPPELDPEETSGNDPPEEPEVFVGTRAAAGEFVGIAPAAYGDGYEPWDLFNFVARDDNNDPLIIIKDKDGNIITDGTFTYGETYSFSISFQERAGAGGQFQYNSDGVLVYTLPSALKIVTPVGIGTNAPGKIYSGGVNGAWIGEYSIDEDGTVNVWFFNVDLDGTATAKNFIDNYTDASFWLEIEAEFKKVPSGTELSFGTDATFTIKLEYPLPSINVVKSVPQSGYNRDNETLTYQIVIRNSSNPDFLDQALTNIKLVDTPFLATGSTSTELNLLNPLSNQAFTGITYSVKKNGAAATEPTDITGLVTWKNEELTTAPTTFEYVFSGVTLEPGETITVTYTLDLKTLIKNNPAAGRTLENYSFYAGNKVDVITDQEKGYTSLRTQVAKTPPDFTVEKNVTEYSKNNEAVSFESVIKANPANGTNTNTRPRNVTILSIKDVPSIINGTNRTYFTDEDYDYSNIITGIKYILPDGTEIVIPVEELDWKYQTINNNSTRIAGGIGFDYTLDTPVILKPGESIKVVYTLDIKEFIQAIGISDTLKVDYYNFNLRNDFSAVGDVGERADPVGVVVEVRNQPVLEIHKSIDSPVGYDSVNETIAYKVELESKGDTPVTKIVVTDIPRFALNGEFLDGGTANIYTITKVDYINSDGTTDMTDEVTIEWKVPQAGTTGSGSDNSALNGGTDSDNDRARLVITFPADFELAADEKVIITYTLDLKKLIAGNTTPSRTLENYNFSVYNSVAADSGNFTRQFSNAVESVSKTPNFTITKDIVKELNKPLAGYNREDETIDYTVVITSTGDSPVTMTQVTDIPRIYFTDANPRHYYYISDLDMAESVITNITCQIKDGTPFDITDDDNLVWGAYSINNAGSEYIPTNYGFKYLFDAPGIVLEKGETITLTYTLSIKELIKAIESKDSNLSFSDSFNPEFYTKLSIDNYVGATGSGIDRAQSDTLEVRREFLHKSVRENGSVLTWTIWIGDGSRRINEGIIYDVMDSNMSLPANTLITLYSRPQSLDVFTEDDIIGVFSLTELAGYFESNPSPNTFVFSIPGWDDDNPQGGKFGDIYRVHFEYDTPVSPVPGKDTKYWNRIGYGDGGTYTGEIVLVLRYGNNSFKQANPRGDDVNRTIDWDAHDNKIEWTSWIGSGEVLLDGKEIIDTLMSSNSARAVNFPSKDEITIKLYSAPTGKTAGNPPYVVFKQPDDVIGEFKASDFADDAFVIDNTISTSKTFTFTVPKENDPIPGDADKVFPRIYRVEFIYSTDAPAPPDGQVVTYSNIIKCDEMSNSDSATRYTPGFGTEIDKTVKNVSNANTNMLEWDAWVGNGYYVLNGGTATDTISSLSDDPRYQIAFPPADEIAIMLYKFPSDSTGSGANAKYSFSDSKDLIGTYKPSDFAEGVFVITGNTFTFEVPSIEAGNPKGGTFPEIYRVRFVYKTDFNVQLANEPEITYRNDIVYANVGVTLDDFTEYTVVPPKADKATVSKETGHPRLATEGIYSGKYVIDYTVTIDIPLGNKGRQLYLRDELTLSIGGTITQPVPAVKSVVLSPAETGIEDFGALCNFVKPTGTANTNAWEMYFRDGVNANSGTSQGTSIWQYNDAKTVTITFTVPLDLTAGSSTIEDALRLRSDNVLTNTVFVRTTGGVNEDEAKVYDIWPIFKARGVMSPDAVIDYTVTINPNMNHSTPLFKSSEPAIFTDVFDNRLAYVPGSFYVVFKPSNRIYGLADDTGIAGIGSITLDLRELERFEPAGAADDIDASWWYSSNTIEIHYQLKIRDEYYYTNESITLKNTAEVISTTQGGAFSDNATVEYRNIPLTKEMSFDTSNVGSVEIIINQDGRPMHPNKEVSFDAFDTMSTNLAFYRNTIKFYTPEVENGTWKKDGDDKLVWKTEPEVKVEDSELWNITINEEIDEATGEKYQVGVFHIPDNTPIKINYLVLIKAQPGETTVKVSNKIEVVGYYEVFEKDGYEIQKSSLFANAQKEMLTLYKEDAENGSIKLGGAKFELYMALTTKEFYGEPEELEELEALGAEPIIINGFPFYLVTDATTSDATGEAVFASDWMTPTHRAMYLLVETVTPTGYVRLDAPDNYTFFVLNDAHKALWSRQNMLDLTEEEAEAINVIETGSIVVTNGIQKDASFHVRKSVASVGGAAIPPWSFDFQLFNAKFNETTGVETIGGEITDQKKTLSNATGGSTTGTFTVGPYSKEGTHYYIVKESDTTGGNWTVNGQYLIRVTVTGTKVLTTEIDYKFKSMSSGSVWSAWAPYDSSLTPTTTPYEFVNTYKPHPTDTVLGAKKVTTGRGAPSIWSFDFDMYNATFNETTRTETWIAEVKEGTLTINNSNADAVGTFNKIDFERAGKYFYIIKETGVSTGIDGTNWSLSDRQYIVEVTVDDINGQLTVTSRKIASRDGSTGAFGNWSDYTGPVSATFTNSYVPNNTEWTPAATKTAENKDLKAGFSFGLFAANENKAITNQTPLQTATNLADGTVTFGSISYSAADVDPFYYIMKELGDDGDGWVYDRTEYFYTVTVVPGDGTLSARVAIMKRTFDAKEQQWSEWTDYTGSAAAFKNVYSPVGEWTITGTKEVNDGAPPAKFQFEILEGTTVVATGTRNGTSLHFEFDTIEYGFSDIGDHVYTIHEVTPLPPGWSMNSNEPIIIYVRVSIDENDPGKLVATAFSDDEYTDEIGDDGLEDFITFNNTYDAEGSLALAGTKFVGLVEGIELIDDVRTPIFKPYTDEDMIAKYEGMFSFLVHEIISEDGEDDEEVLVATGTNDEEGNIIFTYEPAGATAIMYTFADIGIHKYVITEEDSGLGWDAIAGPITFYVNVIDNGDSTLSTQVAADPDAFEEGSNIVLVELADLIVFKNAKWYDAALIKFVSDAMNEPKYDLLGNLINPINKKEGEDGYYESKDTANMIPGEASPAVRVNVGDIVEYTIRVSNQSPWPLMVDSIIDNLPAGLGFVDDEELNAGWKIIPGVDENNDPTDWVEYNWSNLDVKPVLNPDPSYFARFPDKFDFEDFDFEYVLDGEEVPYPSFYDVKLYLEVLPEAKAGRAIINAAMITGITDDEGNPVIDIDSDFDDGGLNTWGDNDKDNFVDGNGRLGEDRDEHDIAAIYIMGRVSVEVAKDTIKRTSAAFDGNELEIATDANGIIENVGIEEYRYDINFRSTSNVAVDEFVVEDPLEGVRDDMITITGLWTPAVWGDVDGLFNVWYKDGGKGSVGADPIYGPVTNPTDGMQLYPTGLEDDGWILWRTINAYEDNTIYDFDETGIIERVRLNLPEGLADGAEITALRFEFGPVKVGFTNKIGSGKTTNEGLGDSGPRNTNGSDEFYDIGPIEGGIQGPEGPNTERIMDQGSLNLLHTDTAPMQAMRAFSEAPFSPDPVASTFPVVDMTYIAEQSDAYSDIPAVGGRDWEPKFGRSDYPTDPIDKAQLEAIMAMEISPLKPASYMVNATDIFMPDNDDDIVVVSSAIAYLAFHEEMLEEGAEDARRLAQTTFGLYALDQDAVLTRFIVPIQFENELPDGIMNPGDRNDTFPVFAGMQLVDGVWYDQYGNRVRTGDTFALSLWIVLIACAALCLVLLIRTFVASPGKKGRKKEIVAGIQKGGGM